MRRLSFGAFVLLLASVGCVSSGQLEESKSRERDLQWRLDAAEKTARTVEAEKKTLQREIEVLQEDNKVARERLALANQTLQDANKDVDGDLKDRLAELQAKSPQKLEL